MLPADVVFKPLRPDARDCRSKNLAPVPVDYQDLLTDAQRASLRNIENFGWSLYFIRRPLFQTPTVVMVNPTGTVHAVLEEDGQLNLEHGLKIRR